MRNEKNVGNNKSKNSAVTHLTDSDLWTELEIAICCYEWMGDVVWLLGNTPNSPLS